MLTFALTLGHSSFLILSALHSTSDAFYFGSGGYKLLLLPRLGTSSVKVSDVPKQRKDSDSVYMFLSELEGRTGRGVTHFGSLTLFYGIFYTFAQSDFEIGESTYRVTTVQYHYYPVQCGMSMRTEFSFTELCSTYTVTERGGWLITISRAFSALWEGSFFAHSCFGNSVFHSRLGKLCPAGLYRCPVLVKALIDYIMLLSPGLHV